MKGLKQFLVGAALIAYSTIPAFSQKEAPRSFELDITINKAISKKKKLSLSVGSVYYFPEQDSIHIHMDWVNKNYKYHEPNTNSYHEVHSGKSFLENYSYSNKNSLKFEKFSSNSPRPTKSDLEGSIYGSDFMTPPQAFKKIMFGEDLDLDTGKFVLYGLEYVVPLTKKSYFSKEYNRQVVEYLATMPKLSRESQNELLLDEPIKVIGYYRTIYEKNATQKLLTFNASPVNDIFGINALQKSAYSPMINNPDKEEIVESHVEFVPLEINTAIQFGFLKKFEIKVKPSKK